MNDEIMNNQPVDEKSNKKQGGIFILLVIFLVIILTSVVIWVKSSSNTDESLVKVDEVQGKYGERPDVRLKANEQVPIITKELNLYLEENDLVNHSIYIDNREWIINQIQKKYSGDDTDYENIPDYIFKEILSQADSNGVYGKTLPAFLDLWIEELEDGGAMIEAFYFDEYNAPIVGTDFLDTSVTLMATSTYVKESAYSIDSYSRILPMKYMEASNSYVYYYYPNRDEDSVCFDVTSQLKRGFQNGKDFFETKKVTLGCVKIDKDLRGVDYLGKVVMYDEGSSITQIKLAGQLKFTDQIRIKEFTANGYVVLGDVDFGFQENGTESTVVGEAGDVIEVSTDVLRDNTLIYKVQEDGWKDGIYCSSVGEVSLTYALSSLSLPRGAIDLYWGTEDSYGAAMGGVAEPLDLVESVVIENNTNERVVLNEINNENLEFYESVTAGGKATPISLLSDKFFIDGDKEVKCAGRSPFNLDIDTNICIFEEPIIIEPHTSIELKSRLYGVAKSICDGRQTADFLDEMTGPDVYVDGKSKKISYVMRSEYHKYDYVADRMTTNIGGFIVVDANNEELANKIFDIETEDGDNVCLNIKGYKKGMSDFYAPKSLPSPSSIIETGEWDEEALILEFSLLQRGLINKSDIDGIYDSNTTSVLESYIKQVQKDNYLFENVLNTGITEHFSSIKGCLWENYGDEAITLGLASRGNLFRLWGSGEVSIDVNKDMSSVSYIVEILISDRGKILFEDGHTLTNRYRRFNILNNTGETVQCTAEDKNNTIIESFLIDSNYSHSFGSVSENVKETGMHTLICGEKSLQVEMFNPSDIEGKG